MALAHKARVSESFKARALYAEAYHAEEAALNTWVVDTGGAEPSRSILCRSAAALAMRAALYENAERLCGVCLSGSPNNSIRTEIADIRTQIAIGRQTLTQAMQNRDRARRYVNELQQGGATPKQFPRRPPKIPHLWPPQTPPPGVIV